MKDLLVDFALSLSFMLGSAIIPLIIYAIRSVGIPDFSWRTFIITSRTRLFLGFVLMALIAVLVTAEPESRKTFSLAANFVATFLGIGGAASFDFGISDPAIGLIVGGLLVAAIGGKKV